MIFSDKKIKLFYKCLILLGKISHFHLLDLDGEGKAISFPEKLFSDPVERGLLGKEPKRLPLVAAIEQHGHMGSVGGGDPDRVGLHGDLL